MKTTRILPAAFAVALFAVGGMSHAFAEEPGEHANDGVIEGPSHMQQSTAPDQGTSWSQSRKDELTMSQARQKAMDKVGGGKIVVAERYGIRKDMYKFDIKKGNATKRVYVNGENGKVEVAVNLDPGLDPTVAGNPYSHDKDEHGN